MITYKLTNFDLYYNYQDRLWAYKTIAIQCRNPTRQSQNDFKDISFKKGTNILVVCTSPIHSHVEPFTNDSKFKLVKTNVTDQTCIYEYKYLGVRHDTRKYFVTDYDVVGFDDEPLYNCITERKFIVYTRRGTDYVYDRETKSLYRVGVRNYKPTIQFMIDHITEEELNDAEFIYVSYADTFENCFYRQKIGFKSPYDVICYLCNKDKK